MPHNLFFNTDGLGNLQNAAGQLVTILDQVLVNGGPSIAISSITRSGTTATVTTTSPHNLNPTVSATFERRLTVSGASQSDYNVEAVCTITGASTFTYQVANSPVTPATGTPVAKLTGLGWTIAFTATNKRSYRQGAGSNAFYFDVDDSVGGYANVRGYETMTAVGTGSNPFPTVAQQAVCTVYKSNGAFIREFVIAGNSKCLRIWTCPNGIFAASGVSLMDFGDVVTEVSGDVYGTTIHARGDTTLTNGYSAFALAGAITNTVPGRYVARLAAGVGTSLAAGVHSDGAKNNGSAVIGIGACAYPAQNGGAYIAPLTLHNNSSPRGVLPGIYDICHAKPFTHFDTFAGNGVFAGKKFIAINTSGTTGAFGQCALEYTPW